MQLVDTLQESRPANQLATLLKAAGDPLRLEVLRVLTQDSYGVLELSHIFDIKQNGMSHHLKVLANAGLVTTRREGNSIFYRRNTTQGLPEYEEHALAHVLACVDQLALSPDLDTRITEVHAQRAEASRKFFNEHGSNLKEKQDLIAAFGVYGEQVAHFLKHCQIPQREHALEVGPGEGQFLPLLAEQFKAVWALDNSDNMLESARVFCKSTDNIHFISGDTRWCYEHPQHFDAVVINMVLHHTPSPQQIFQDVKHCLRAGGVLVICELSQHNQDWTRQACGDLWLGFEANELTRWAAAAGLQEGESTYFALRNGFQIQIREFISKL